MVAYTHCSHATKAHQVLMLFCLEDTLDIFTCKYQFVSALWNKSLKALGIIFFPRADLKNKWHLVMDRLTVLFLKFLQYVHQLQLFIWWLLELHIIKIVSSYIIWVSVKEVRLFGHRVDIMFEGYKAFLDGINGSELTFTSWFPMVVIFGTSWL